MHGNKPVAPDRLLCNQCEMIATAVAAVVVDRNYFRWIFHMFTQMLIISFSLLWVNVPMALARTPTLAHLCPNDTQIEAIMCTSKLHVLQLIVAFGVCVCVANFYCDWTAIWLLCINSWYHRHKFRIIWNKFDMGPKLHDIEMNIFGIVRHQHGSLSLWHSLSLAIFSGAFHKPKNKNQPRTWRTLENAWRNLHVNT